MVNDVSSRLIVRAEIHCPPCSSEQEGTQTPVDLGESAGAVSLDGSVELSGAPSLGGSGGLPGDCSSGGLDELPEELTLGGSGGPSGVVRITDSCG